MDTRLELKEFFFFSVLAYNASNTAGLWIVMVHNPAHDLFSIGIFLCRVRVVDCWDPRNRAERQ